MIVEQIASIENPVDRATAYLKNGTPVEWLRSKGVSDSVIEQAQQRVDPAQQPAETVVAGIADAGMATVTFADRARVALRYGIPVVPALPRQKATIIGSKEATTDLPTIEKWNQAEPNYNSCLVAQAKLGGVWILDCDSPEVKQQIEKDTGKKLPDTFSVQSSSAGHRYFRQNEESLKRLRTFSVHRGDKEFFSVRFDNMYCVGPLSVHPSGAIYKIVRDAEPVEAPSWLLDWLLAQGEETKLPVTASSEGPRIPRGSHDNELTRIAGKLRAAGLSEAQMLPILIEDVEARFDDYGSDYVQMCEKVAHSIGKKPAGTSSIPLTSGGKTAEQIMRDGAQQVAAQQLVEDQEPEIDDTELTTRPVFPEWVMPGTSLYENFVKPSTEASDKYAELIFMPALQMYLNVLAGRVYWQRGQVPNLFLGLIAPYGHFFKSSSCELAQEYFKVMGFAADYQNKMAAGDKTMIVSAGSPEGLGLRMRDCNGTHAVLYFDELGVCVGKASIDHSTYVEQLCIMYESRKFENEIKSKKDSFSFPAGQYCFSWLWCTTDRKFPQLWMALANEDSGLNDRMFFLLSPEKERAAMNAYAQPDLASGALETRKLIERAILQKQFDYDLMWDRSDVQEMIKGIDPRSQAMFQNLALYFAVDLGRDAIDAECCKRARALVDYRNQTLLFLDPVQADTFQGKIQMQIVRMLRLHHGKMSLRELKKEMHAERLGSRVWTDAFRGLINDGAGSATIAYREAITGKGTKPKDRRAAMVYLLKQEDV